MKPQDPERTRTMSKTLYAEIDAHAAAIAILTSEWVGDHCYTDLVADFQYDTEDTNGVAAALAEQGYRAVTNADRVDSTFAVELLG